MTEQGSTHLREETAFFDRMRKTWIGEGHEREFAVVQGEGLLGFYATLGEGYKAGVSEFGAGKFLVKEVKPADDIEIVHRVAWGKFGS